MTFTVHIENFQSIKSATLRVDGFTVLCGRNNSGKTAVMRAIRGVFTNPPAGALIRHGESELSVEIRFDDGQWVRWEKNVKGKAKYTVNGVVLQNVGRTTPPEVLALGIRPVSAGGVKVWPQFAQQFTGQVFLLKMPGSALAEAISDVTRVGRLNKALKSSQSDHRAAQQVLTLRRGDLEKTQQALKKFEGLDDLGSTLVALKRREEEVASLRKRISSLEALNSIRSQYLQVVDSLQGLQEVSLPSVESLRVAREAVASLKTHRRLSTQRRTACAAVESLRQAPLSGVPTATRVGDLSARVVELREWKDLRARQRLLQEQVEHLGNLPGDQVEGLREGQIAALKALKALAQLQGLARSRQQARLAVERLEGSLSDSRQELEFWESNVHELLDSRGDCPLCGQEVAS